MPSAQKRRNNIAPRCAVCSRTWKTNPTRTSVCACSPTKSRQTSSFAWRMTNSNQTHNVKKNAGSTRKIWIKLWLRRRNGVSVQACSAASADRRRSRIRKRKRGVQMSLWRCFAHALCVESHGVNKMKPLLDWTLGFGPIARPFHSSLFLFLCSFFFPLLVFISPLFPLSFYFSNFAAHYYSSRGGIQFASSTFLFVIKRILCSFPFSTSLNGVVMVKGFYSCTIWRFLFIKRAADENTSYVSFSIFYPTLSFFCVLLCFHDFSGVNSF